MDKDLMGYENSEEVGVTTAVRESEPDKDDLIHDLKLSFEIETDFVADLRAELARRDDEIAKLRAEVARLRRRIEHKQMRLNQVKDQIKELKGVQA